MSASGMDHEATLRSPPPAVDEAEAAALSARHFGVEGVAHRLASERDANFLIRSATGVGRLLKITNAREPVEATDFQTAALLHLERTAPDLPVPRIVSGLRNELYIRRDGGGFLRMLTYLEGRGATSVPKSQAIRKSAARIGASLDRALGSFSHRFSAQKLIWDIQHAADLRPILDSIPSASLRRSVETVLDNFEGRVVPVLRGLRHQFVHADLNPNNLICNEDGDEIIGVIDFGDMVYTPLVCDVAVAAAYQVDYASPVGTAAEFVGEWHRHYALLPGEIALLPDLIAVRLATIIAVSSWRADRHPENAAYILRNFDVAAGGLERLERLDRAELLAALQDATRQEEQA